jgi:hypothetical protein
MLVARAFGRPLSVENELALTTHVSTCKLCHDEERDLAAAIADHDPRTAPPAALAASVMSSVEETCGAFAEAGKKRGVNGSTSEKKRGKRTKTKRKDALRPDLVVRELLDQSGVNAQEIQQIHSAVALLLEKFSGLERRAVEAEAKLARMEWLVETLVSRAGHMSAVGEATPRAEIGTRKPDFAQTHYILGASVLTYVGLAGTLHPLMQIKCHSSRDVGGAPLVPSDLVTIHFNSGRTETPAMAGSARPSVLPWLGGVVEFLRLGEKSR